MGTEVTGGALYAGGPGSQPDARPFAGALGAGAGSHAEARRGASEEGWRGVAMTGAQALSRAGVAPGWEGVMPGCIGVAPPCADERSVLKSSRVPVLHNRTRGPGKYVPRYRFTVKCASMERSKAELQHMS